MLLLQSDDDGRRLVEEAECGESPLDPTHVEVEMEFAALNRIDVLLIEGRLKPPSRRHVLGAEGAGKVRRIGSEVTGLTVGDLVVLYPYAGCGRCPGCVEHNPSVCRATRIMGVTEDGAFRRLLRMPAARLLPAPPDVSPRMAAVALTVGIALHVLQCRGRLSAGETVAIGPVTSGLGTACGVVAARLGAHVIGVGREQSLRAVEKDAPNWLADVWTWDGAEPPTGRAHLAVDAAGSISAFLHKRLMVGGRMVVVGGHAASRSDVDLWRLFTREQEIRGSHGCHRADLVAALRLLEDMNESDLVDSIYDGTSHLDAYARLDTPGKFGKVLLDCRSSAWGEGRV